MSGPANPVAGWYSDPSDPASSLRFWDGTSWTDQTAPFEPAPAYSDQAGSWQGVGWGASREPEPASWPTSPGAAPGAASGTVLGAASGVALGRAPGSALGSAPGPVPGAPGWQSGPGGIYAPAPPQPAKKSRIGLIVAAGVVALVVVIGGLVALAVPTYNRISGHTWFNGGVPGWSPIRVSNFPSKGATFLQVARLKVRPAAGETATQYLTGTLQYLATHGPGSGRLVIINDGAPALEWSRPTPLADDPNLAITSFWLYAENGGKAYWIAFQTDTEHYVSELPGVEAVMLNFKGTGQ